MESEESQERRDEKERTTTNVHVRAAERGTPNKSRLRTTRFRTFISRPGHGQPTKPYHVDTLKHIALLGGTKEYVGLSSKELGKMLGVSQQSASQRILELLEAGLIQRDLAVRRQRVRLSPKGLEMLRKEFADYKRIFEVHEGFTIRGVVTSGLGEGAFYMKQRGYKEQFRRKLGYEPFEGTLNVRIQGSELAKLDILWKEPGIAIDGFVDTGRTFGGAKCFPAKLQGVDCGVILPIRTHHTDNLELISRVHLRSKLDLVDGALIAVDVRLVPGANVE